MTRLPAATLAQLEAAGVQSGRPLLISDADEVLFRFVESFVSHIEERGHSFDWSSFRLTGCSESKSLESGVETLESVAGSTPMNRLGCMAPPRLSKAV